MDTAILPPFGESPPTMPVARFNADQYIEMIRAGILGEDDRVELIDGYIVPMSPAGENHYWVVLRLTDALSEAMPTHF